MKSLRMFKLPALLLGVGGALLLAPGCKAQEVSPDQFTETGVADVYHASSPAKVVTPAIKLKSNAQVSPVRARQADAQSTLQLASNVAALPAQPAAQPAERKRKPASAATKKP